MMMENTNGDTTMENYGAVITGRYIVAHRNDGRVFAGQMESVKALPKGTFVVVRMADDTCRSFYLEGLTEWRTFHTEAEYAAG